MSFKLVFRLVGDKELDRILKSSLDEKLAFLYCYGEDEREFWRSQPVEKINKFTSNEERRRIIEERLSRAPVFVDRFESNLGFFLVRIFEPEADFSGLLQNADEYHCGDSKCYIYDRAAISVNIVRLSEVLESFNDYAQKLVNIVISEKGRFPEQSPDKLADLTLAVKDVVYNLRNLLLKANTSSDLRILEHWEP